MGSLGSIHVTEVSPYVLYCMLSHVNATEFCVLRKEEWRLKRTICVALQQRSHAAHTHIPTLTKVVSTHLGAEQSLFYR